MKANNLNLTLITATRDKLRRDLFQENKKHDETVKILRSRIDILDREEQIALADIDLAFVRIAREVLEVKGEPYNIVDGRSIVEVACSDIALGCPELMKRRFANLQFRGKTGAWDLLYAQVAPGLVLDSVALLKQVPLTDIQTEACIYYLRNYKKIREAEAAVAKGPAADKV